MGFIFFAYLLHIGNIGNIEKGGGVYSKGGVHMRKGFIWNLATPDIDVYVDIEDHDIDVFVDIEYSNLDIDVTVFDIVVTKKTSISTKRRYRRLDLRYRV